MLYNLFKYLLFKTYFLFLVSSYEQQCENIQFLKDTSTKLNKMKDDLSIVFTYFQKQVCIVCN